MNDEEIELAIQNAYYAPLPPVNFEVDPEDPILIGPPLLEHHRSI